MNEKGILFSGEMVRAILERRKTQTRRIIKPQPKGRLCYRMMASHGVGKWGYLSLMAAEMWGEKYDFLEAISEKERDRLWNPPFHTGDLLYVRETWALAPNNEVVYRASNPEWSTEQISFRWRPSIHMPKSAARIWLKVKRVSVERLQDISETDAKAEGAFSCGFDSNSESYRSGFVRTWLECYGDNSWKENPWVWVTEFEQIEVKK